MKNKKIGRDIHIVSNKIKRKMDAAVHQFGITHTQFHIMHYIYLQDRAVYQKDIENAFNLRRSTVSKILSLLEKKELIAKQSVETDARLKQIALTDKGIAKHDQVDNNTFDEINKELLSKIENDDLEIFYKVLNKLSELTD